MRNAIIPLQNAQPKEDLKNGKSDIIIIIIPSGYRPVEPRVRVKSTIHNLSNL
jgi:hypothetical protein